MTEVVLMYFEYATGPSKSELYDRLPKVLKLLLFWPSPNDTMFMLVFPCEGFAFIANVSLVAAPTKTLHLHWLRAHTSSLQKLRVQIHAMAWQKDYMVILPNPLPTRNGYAVVVVDVHQNKA